MKWWWGRFVLRWIFIVLAHWKNNPRKDTSVPLGHNDLIASQPVFVLAPECCVFSREAVNTSFIVFSLTRPGIEPTIYRTWGEHANHYTTDAVNSLLTKYMSIETASTFTMSSPVYVFHGFALLVLTHQIIDLIIYIIKYPRDIVWYVLSIITK